MNFSVVLIARNEEKTLPRMLLTLKPFLDADGEVVVVDTGSSDETVDVARRAGCLVQEEGNRFRSSVTPADVFAARNYLSGILSTDQSCFRFDDARNYAAGLASNDWILMPDADEFYPVFDFEELDQRIAGAKHDRFSYRFVFGRDALGQEYTAFRQSKLYNRRALRWSGIIHEELEPYQLAKEDLPDSVLSVEHAQNAQTDRSGYLTALIVQHFRNPSEPRTLHYLGRELYYRGRHADAIRLLEQHTRLPHADRAESSQSFIHIGDAWKAQAHAAEAEQAWFLAFARDPSRRDGLLRLAQHYLASQQFELAIRFAEWSKDIPENGFYANVRSYYGSFPDEVLYAAYWWHGDQARAKEAFERARITNPSIDQSSDASFFLNDAAGRAAE